MTWATANQSMSRPRRVGGEDSKENPAGLEFPHLEVVRFLWERAHAEAHLFYTRTNLMMTLETVTLAATLRGMFAGDLGVMEVRVIAVPALIVTVAWMMIHRRAVRYNWTYLNAVGKMLGAWLDQVVEELDVPGLRAEDGAAKRKWRTPFAWPVTRWFFLIIVVFLVIWVSLLAWADGILTRFA